MFLIGTVWSGIFKHYIGWTIKCIQIACSWIWHGFSLHTLTNDVLYCEFHFIFLQLKTSCKRYHLLQVYLTLFWRTPCLFLTLLISNTYANCIFYQWTSEIHYYFNIITSNQWDFPVIILDVEFKKKKKKETPQFCWVFLEFTKNRYQEK